MVRALLGASNPGQLLPAREQMAFTLCFHIILVPFGVAFTFLMLIANYRGIRRRDDDALLLARRWSKVAAVLFAVGAVSGNQRGAVGLSWCVTAVNEHDVDLLFVHDDNRLPAGCRTTAGGSGSLTRRRSARCARRPPGRHPTSSTRWRPRCWTPAARVEHVYADTRLAEHVVAALLRFPVPRPFAT